MCPNYRAAVSFIHLQSETPNVLANWLQFQSIAAEPYYGGKREGVPRAELEQALLDNNLKVLVATTALGMGYD
jgi:ATP-dependent DNA helicase RecQ